MHLVEGKCPNCGANIKVDPNKDAAICDYCGSAYVTDKAIYNFNINKANIHADKIEKVENYNTVYEGESAASKLVDNLGVMFGIQAMKDSYDPSPEARERVRLRKEEAKKATPPLIAFSLLCFLGVFYLGHLMDVEEKKSEEKKAKDSQYFEQGMIKVDSAYAYKNVNYEAVVRQLELLGFENIEAIDLDDAGLFEKDGEVEDITIGGKDDFSDGDFFYPTDQVIITYH